MGIEFSPYKENGILPKGVPKEAYFTIIEKGGNYFLKGVSPVSATKCNE